MPSAELHQDLRTRRPRPVQGVSRQLLARARRGARVSRRLRQGADRRRLSRGADSRGVRRLRASASTEASIILEEINRSGGNAGACHAQMYTMGTLLRHGSDAQKRAFLPKIATGELRLQAFGVTEPTTGSDTTQLKTTATRKGDQLHRPRSEGLDLARRALGSAAAGRPHDADRAGEEADRGAVDPAGRSARGGRPRPDDPADPHDDEPRDDRAVLRRSRSAGRRRWSARKARASATCSTG